MYKALFVIGGHRDKLKEFMVHSSQTLQPATIRLMLALAVMLGYEIWISDVKQAYLQSKDGLQRPIFIKDLVEEFELPTWMAL